MEENNEEGDVLSILDLVEQFCIANHIILNSTQIQLVQKIVPHTRMVLPINKYRNLIVNTYNDKPSIYIIENEPHQTQINENN